MEGSSKSIYEEEHKSHLLRLTNVHIEPIPQKRSFLKRWLIHPDSRFKITWDLIVIIFSVYNSILIPYEFAYSIDTSVFFEVIDRIVDVAFLVDILINFRAMFRDSRTDELVTSGK